MVVVWVEIGWGFQRKIGRNPMDKASGLRSSLLPHREDSIPELEPLLALVLKFKDFFTYPSALIPLQRFRLVK